MSVAADRRGYDGPIQLTMPDLPKGIHVEGGIIPREYLDASNARTFNRRGVLLLTADQGVDARRARTAGVGRGRGSPTARCCGGGRAASAMAIDVSGATAQGVVDRQRPITAPWLGVDLPVAMAERRPRRSKCGRPISSRWRRASRYEYAYKWTIARPRRRRRQTVGVDVIGAKDLRVIDMKSENGAMSGTFAVTTTKATDPARYDLYISGRLRTDDGDEIIFSRPIAFEVTGGTAQCRTIRLALLIAWLSAAAGCGRRPKSRSCATWRRS